MLGSTAADYLHADDCSAEVAIVVTDHQTGHCLVSAVRSRAKLAKFPNKQ
jgi:hypothetical protein